MLLSIYEPYRNLFEEPPPFVEDHFLCPASWSLQHCLNLLAERLRQFLLVFFSGSAFCSPAILTGLEHRPLVRRAVHAGGADFRR